MNVDYKNKSFRVEQDSRGRLIYSRPPVRVLFQCRKCKEWFEDYQLKDGHCEKCCWWRKWK